MKNTRNTTLENLKHQQQPKVKKHPQYQPRKTKTPNTA